MRIYCARGLEPLATHATQAYHSAVEERERIGFDELPQFRLDLCYTLGGPSATAGPEHEMPVMRVAAAHTLTLDENERQRAEHLDAYHQLTTIALPDMPPTRLGAFLNDPPAYLANESQLARQRATCLRQGISLEHVHSILNERAWQAKIAFCSIRGNTHRTSQSRMHELIRHEADHIDIFRSPLYEKFLQTCNAWDYVRSSQKSPRGLDREMLDAELHMRPLLEARAIYLSEQITNASDLAQTLNRRYAQHSRDTALTALTLTTDPHTAAALRERYHPHDPVNAPFDKAKISQTSLTALTRAIEHHEHKYKLSASRAAAAVVAAAENGTLPDTSTATSVEHFYRICTRVSIPLSLRTTPKPTGHTPS